jgi:hypothetical protein
MSIEAIKEELAGLDEAGRRQIINFLADLEERAEMGRLIDDKNPANWISLEALQKQLKLGKYAKTE